jgi:hypothetical protein
MQVVENVLDLARVFLDDQNVQLWTDAILTPMYVRAHEELQVLLRQRAAPLMKTVAYVLIEPGVTLMPLITDLVSPIQLFETPLGIQNYIMMTESDPLPNNSPGPILNWWQWDGLDINFIGATIAREVQVFYWRNLIIPTDPTAPVGIIDGEMWLAPRTAAIAAASVGQTDSATLAGQEATETIEKVILANRGRSPQEAGVAIRP